MTADADARLDALLARWQKTRLGHFPHLLSELIDTGDDLADALLDARAEADALLGITSENGWNPGPYPNCHDCGRAMVWSRRTGDCPEWICPEHVYQRLTDADKAIREYVEAKRHGNEWQRDVAWNHLLGAAHIAPLGSVDAAEACESCERRASDVAYRADRDVPLCDACAAALDTSDARNLKPRSACPDPSADKGGRDAPPLR